MADHHDTLVRIIKMLQSIPRHPGRIATTTLQSKLEDQGFHITLRSLQRDLKRMEYYFPIKCDDSETPYRWSFDKDYSQSLPGMDANKALTLVLSNQYLHTLLPQTVVDALAPQVKEAQRFLDAMHSNNFSRWRHRVRAISSGRALLPASVDPDVWEAATNGLLQEQALEVVYHSRYKDQPDSYTLHPQGLVHRHSVTYLLATAKTYDDILQFALHRFESVVPSAQLYRRMSNFDVDQYITSGGFGYTDSQKPVNLEVWVSPELHTRLTETPLTLNQTLTRPDDSGWGYLTATVNDEKSMLWWLQGLGATARVVEPAHWRKSLEAQAKQLVEWYSQSDK